MSEKHENNTCLKSDTKLSKARFAALSAVNEIIKKEAFVKSVLDKTLDAHVLSSSDRAFAAKLTLGVIQTLGTLDEVIQMCVSSPDDIKPNVLNPLRISAYEILYLEKEPHAAVDQGVEMVKLVEPRAKGLANLVLRRIVNQKKEFPFGNPETDDEAFARIYAVPQWECKLIYDSIGKNAGQYLISSCNGRPTTYLFVNTLKISVDEIVQILKEEDAEPSVLESLCGSKLSNCIKVANPAVLQRANFQKMINDELILHADASSQLISQLTLSASKNPKSMLEFCAGRGNKSIMFQVLANQKFGHQLELTTVDNIEYKAGILKGRCKKAGVNVKNCATLDAADYSQITEVICKVDVSEECKFDIVFVDAPCSCLGTLRRHPELKWRLTPAAINKIAATSSQILKNASKYVAPGGILVYSTCTVTKVENEDLCENFLNSSEGEKFKLLPYRIKDKEFKFLHTQTFSGLNDSHFSAVFKKEV